MTVGTLRAILRLDDSQFQRGVGRSEGRFRRMGRTVGKVAKGAALGIAGIGAAAIGGAFKVADFGDSIAKAARTAGVNSGTFQELRFAFGQAGITAENFDASMRRLNRRLGLAAQGGGPAAGAFDELGVAVNDANGQVRDTDDVLDEALTRLGEVESGAERAALASQLFGEDAGPGLAAALEDGGQAIDDAREKARELGIVMGEDALRQAEEFGDQWDDIKQTVLGALRQGLTPVMGFLNDQLFPFVRETLIPLLRRLADWLGPRLSQAAEAIGEWWEGTVRPALQRLAAWWLENGPQIMARAREIWDTIVEAARPVVEWITGTLLPILGRLFEWWHTSGPGIMTQAKVLGTIVSTAFDVISGAIETVIGWFQSAGESSDENTSWIADTFQRLSEIASKLWGAISKVVSLAIEGMRQGIQVFTTIVEAVWSRWGDTIMKVTQAAWDIIKTVIETVVGVIQGIITLFLATVQGDWSGAWEAIKGIAETIWNGIKGVIEGLINAVKAIISGTLDNIKRAWRLAWETVKSFVSEKWEEIKTAVRQKIEDVLTFMRELPGRITGALGDLGSLLFNAGKRVIKGLIDGIKSMVPNVGSAMSGVAKTVRDRLPFSPAKFGPLADHPPEQAGRNIVGDIARGMGRVDLGEALARQLPDLGALPVELAAVGGDGAAAVDQRRETNLTVTVHNPRGEPTEQTLSREARRLAFEGVLG